MDDDGWNRPLYVTWSMSMDRKSSRNLGLQIAKNYHVQSNSHYTRPIQRSQSAELFLFPPLSGEDKWWRIRIDRVWCEMDCNFPTVAVRGISYLVQSTLVQTSQISHFNISCFLDTKKPILFFCLDVASFVREVDESFSESQQMQMSHHQNWGQNLGSEFIIGERFYLERDKIRN